MSSIEFPWDVLKEPRVAYSPESRQFVVELELPPFGVIPDAREYRYVKARDEITTTALPAARRKALYGSVVAQAALVTGTMQNEGATKGILVTTSGYGQASHEFANGKPLELIDGPNLLYLLKEHADVEAKIVPPEDWVDPARPS